VRIGCFLGWLSVVVIAWKISNRPWKQELHAFIGLPTFLLHVWMNADLVRYVASTRRARLRTIAVKV
jgi:hypothetical protein